MDIELFSNIRIVIPQNSNFLNRNDTSKEVNANTAELTAYLLPFCIEMMKNV